MANGRGRFRTGPSFDDRATGKFSGSPAGWRGSDRQPGLEAANIRQRYPTPSNRQPGFGIANTRVAQGRGLGDIARNVAGNVGQRAANVGRGFVHPLVQGMQSIANNQAQHDYLDEVYGRDKGRALFGQATDQFYDRGIYAPGSFEPELDFQGASLGDIGDIGRGTETIGGTSFGQAKKYLNKAGVSDQEIERYIKEGKSDGWLAAQVEGGGAEDFATGMSFIKNAKATANLARSTAAAGMENEMYGGRPLEGPSFDDAATRVRSYPEDTFGDFRSGIEQEGGPPRSYPPDVMEDITADIAPSPYDVTTGYDRDKIYDFERQRPKTTFRNRFTGQKHDPYDLVGTPTFPFSEENMAGDYTAGYPGMEVMNTMSPGETSMWRGPGGGAADMDRLYMNRIGDVMNQGRYSAVPNISVSFGDEEETPFERYNPRSY